MYLLPYSSEPNVETRAAGIVDDFGFGPRKTARKSKIDYPKLV